MRKLLIFGAIICVSAVMLVGCGNSDGGVKPVAKPPLEQVVLYYANKDATKVVAEKRDVTEEKKTMQGAVEQLIAGPNNNRAQSLFPTGVKCLSVTAKNGVASVDFNSAIKEVKSQLGAGEQLVMMASLVNTLTEFDGISAVNITINGAPIKALGDLDLSEPLGRSDELIEK